MNTNKTLAGLAVFRTLYDSEKDIYEVIACFLKEIIYKNKLHCFSDTEIAGILNETYQFEIPTPVIKSALKRISYVEKTNGQYTITDYKQVSTVISEKETDILNNHESILSQLYVYIEKELKKELDQNQKAIIQASFCDFLLDNDTDAEYIKFITGYILTKKEDLSFKEKLETVREGVILHTGIRYNSDPSDRGSWKAHLTIFIDQEILFHIAGYNGEIFQEQALELLGYIKELNKKEFKISLKYFPETKEEIDLFFNIAERIVKGQQRLNPRITAMTKIINGCSTGSEIQCKKDDFYNLIENTYKISLDKYDNYYDDKNHKYNILDLNDYQDEEDETYNQSYNSLSHLNYVSIRRQDNPANNFETIGYILLTGKKRTQSIASEKCTKGCVPLSTNIGFLINKFWFKSNRGLSKSFPKSFNIISKSQIILSKIINDNVGSKYNELQREIKQNKITKEQANSRYQHLRSTIKHPEEINNDVIQDMYSFIEDSTESYLAEQEKLKENSEKLEKQKKELVTADKKRIEIINELISSKKENLNTYEEKCNKLNNKNKEFQYNIEKLTIKRDCKNKAILIAIAVLLIISIIGACALFLINKESIFKTLKLDNQPTLLNVLEYIIPLVFTLIFYSILAITGKSFSINKAITKIRKQIIDKLSSSTDNKIKIKIEKFEENVNTIQSTKENIQKITSEINDLCKQLPGTDKC